MRRAGSHDALFSEGEPRCENDYCPTVASRDRIVGAAYSAGVLVRVVLLGAHVTALLVALYFFVRWATAS